VTSTKSFEDFKKKKKKIKHFSLGEKEKKKLRERKSRFKLTSAETLI
jgi:hypothetical protein